MSAISFATLRRGYTRALRSFLIALVVVLLAIMTLQVILRSTGHSLIWAEEVCRYLLIWVSFIAIAMAYERGEIAAVTLLRDRLPRVPALVLAIFCNLCGIVLCAVLVWYGVLYAQRAGGSPIPALRFVLEDGLGWSAGAVPHVFWVYLALPLGMALLGLRLAIDAVRYAIAIRRDERVVDLHAYLEGEAVPAELHVGSVKGSAA